MPLVMQRFRMKLESPGFKVVKYIREKEIVWEGYLQANPLQKQYKVRIKYDFKMRPTVTLPDENFETVKPPHTFISDDSLCLYSRFGTGAWTNDKPMTSLIPMISHWLWCYEMWLVTGNWYGEEYPHPANEEKEPD